MQASIFDLPDEYIDEPAPPRALLELVPKVERSQPAPSTEPVTLHRVDAYAEHLIGQGIYTDTGCELSASCLACPFPICRFDSPRGLTPLRTKSKETEVIVLISKGLSRREAAAEMGLSIRQVYRILSNAQGLRLIEGGKA